MQLTLRFSGCLMESRHVLPMIMEHWCMTSSNPEGTKSASQVAHSPSLDPALMRCFSLNYGTQLSTCSLKSDANSTILEMPECKSRTGFNWNLFLSEFHWINWGCIFTKAQETLFGVPQTQGVHPSYIFERLSIPVAWRSNISTCSATECCLPQQVHKLSNQVGI